MAFESGWTPIVELEQGIAVSNKLDDAFANVDDGLAAITDNTDLLARLTPLYEVDKQADIFIATAGQWYDAGQVWIINPHPASWYQVTFSILYTINSTTESAFFRYSTDNGLSWTEFEMESADKKDKYPIAYTFPMNIAENEPFGLRVQASKDSAAVMTVLYADVMVEKKLDLSTT